MQKNYISDFQAGWLLFNVVGSTAVLVLPAVAARAAGRDAWAAPVVATLPAAVGILIVAYLGRRLPQQNLFDWAETICGRIIGKLITLYIFSFLLYNTAVIVREYGELIQARALPSTPLLFSHLVLLLVVGYCLYLGLEVLARTGELLLPAGTVIFIAMLVLAFFQAHPERLMPVMEYGFLPVLKAAVTPTAFRGELVLMLAIIYPYLRSPRVADRAAHWVNIALMLILVVNAAAHTMVLGFDTDRQNFPTFTLIEEINIYQFFARFEVFAVSIWIIALFVKLGLFTYAAASALAHLIGSNDQRPLIAPLLTVILPWSVTLFPGLPAVKLYISHVFPYWAYTVEYGIPCLLAAGYYLKKHLKNRSSPSPRH